MNLRKNLDTTPEILVFRSNRTERLLLSTMEAKKIRMPVMSIRFCK